MSTFTLIDELPFGAAGCALIPGVQRDPDGFLDTGRELTGIDPHVYLSLQAIKQAAAEIGWLPPSSIADAVAERERAEERVTELEKQVLELEACIEAIDVIESAGFRARRKTGRPQTKSERKGQPNGTTD